MQGTLTLIPTPIDEENPLEGVALNLLKKAALEDKDSSLFVIEELKIGRQRWLRFGLPRECVDSFILLNEHNATTVSQELVKELKAGKNVYIMSDGGLPAFCDPGREIVDLCHKEKIKVTSTPFSNSISLALALSGFSHSRFVFEGFLPAKTEERLPVIKSILNEPRTVILMDTPYRLKKVLEDFKSTEREIFLALDLNSKKEELIRGKAKTILAKLNDLKREFILVLAPLNQ